MYYLVDNMLLNMWNIYVGIENVPEKYKDVAVQVDALPEGSGILRRAEDGTFYYEPYPEETEPPDIETPTETKPPELSVEEMQAQILLNTEYLVSRAELGLGGV